MGFRYQTGAELLGSEGAGNVGGGACGSRGGASGLQSWTRVGRCDEGGGVGTKRQADALEGLVSCVRDIPKGFEEGRGSTCPDQRPFLAPGRV